MNKKSQEDILNFWNAPKDALFSQKIISQVTNYSESWLERQRWAGGGIPYLKVGRKCLYRKADVVGWLNQYQTVSSTSEYEEKIHENI